MKHISFYLLGLILVPFIGLAQKRPITIPAQNYSEYYFQSMMQSAGQNELPDMVAQPNRIEATSPLRAGGGAIWEEDFAGGFPAGWAVTNVSGNNPWKWSTNGSHGYFNGTSAAGYAAPIASTTAANGFLISDADSANHFSFGQPSGTNYQYHESYFATNAIDLGASYSSLLLQFEQFFRYNNSLDLKVQVSADSINWTEYTVQGAIGNNTASPNPDLATVNISAAVGSSQTVYLRIGWNARVYYWMIDDMRIIQGQDNDLALTKAYHGDIILDYQYSKIPLEQATEMVIGAVVTNLGGLTQTNVSVDYNIKRNGTSVSTGTFPFPASIAAADADTVWYSTGFTPTQLGNYDVSMTVSADNPDENLANQSKSSLFQITDSIFAHDYENNFTIQTWGQATSGGLANAYAQGNVFFPVNSGSSIYAIDVALGSNTDWGTSIIAEVHEIGANIQDIVETYETVYDVEQSDVNGGSNFFFTTIVLSDLIELNAGTGYLIALRSEGGQDSLWVLSNSGDEDYSTAMYGPYGTGGAVNWYNGWNHTPAVRMKLAAQPSAIGEANSAARLKIYPNPTNGLVSITTSAADRLSQVNLFNVEGKQIRSYNAGQSNSITKLEMDVTGLAPGVYFVNVTSQEGTWTEKLIIQ